MCFIIRKCYGSFVEFIKVIDYYLKVVKENEDLDRVEGYFCNFGMVY